MLRVLLGLAVLALATQGFAQEHGAAPGEHGGIPWEMLQKQAFNFLLVLGLLVYFLRGKITEYFKARVDTFEKQAILAKKAKQEAEDQKHEMKNRLEKLQATAVDSVDRARREAEELRKKIEAEALALAAQLKNDASETAAREIERAKAELKEEVLALAMAQTREHMKTSVKETDQTRLQNEFVDKIQVGR